MWKEPGLDQFMRDEKKKICRDCELVALLEVDNDMELLVSDNWGDNSFTLPYSC